MRKTGTKIKDEPFDYFRERDTLRKQYTELMDKAGIAAAVERCERRLEPDYFEDRHLPSLFIKARAEATELQYGQKFQSFRHCQRDVIFAVTDDTLRKQLISADRKFRDLKLQSFQHDLTAAQRRLNGAGAADRYGGFVVAAVGAVIVIFGWQLGGAMGGTAAAVFALIAAMYGLPELERMRSRDVQRATAEVADLEATICEIIDQEVFSQFEEDTGKEDKFTPGA